MKNRTQLILDVICGLILIAVLVVPVFAQRAAEQANANAARHTTVSAAYHKGANLTRP